MRREAERKGREQADESMKKGVTVAIDTAQDLFNQHAVIHNDVKAEKILTTCLKNGDLLEAKRYLYFAKQVFEAAGDYVEIKDRRSQLFLEMWRGDKTDQGNIRNTRALHRKFPMFSLANIEELYKEAGQEPDEDIRALFQ